MLALRAAAVTVVTTFILAACGAPAEPNPPTTEPPITPLSPDDTGVLRSNLARNTSPNVPAGDLATLVDGNSALALALYDRFRGATFGNFFYSPLSISEALAMAWAGARGRTESEMASTLHYDLDQSRLHPAMNELDLELQSRGSGAKGVDGKGFRLQLSNALWGQRGYTILQPFLDVLAQSYGAGLRVLNFRDQPDLARQIINDWVAAQTEGKIKDLIDHLESNTRLVLTNTIYFNAAWNKTFPADATADRAFHRLDGSTVTAPAMTIVEAFPHALGAGWQAVELPYDGQQIAMTVIVPDAGNFQQVESQLVSGGLQAVLGALKTEETTLVLPKWKAASRFKMKEVLKPMGMVDPFDAIKANFTGINGGIEPLWIDEVIHQSFISVDEKGTEAAAATAVIMAGSGVPPAPLVVDRPFIYLIRDLATGSILFAGRIMDPTAG